MAAGMSMTLLGAKGIKRGLLKAGSVYDRALGEALDIEATEIFAESQDLVPVKHSFLQGSGVKTQVKKDSRGGLYIEIGYGTKYALPVHYMSESNNFTKAGTGPRYLQRPFEDHMRGWRKRVAKNTWARARAEMAVRGGI